MPLRGSAGLVPAPGPRVAMLHGRADPAHDGVADYTRRLVEALRGAGTEVVDVPLDPGAAGALRAARTVRGAGVDVVHLQFAPSAFGFSGWPGLLLGDLIGTRPLVTTVHEYGWWSWAPRVPAALWSPCERRRLLDRETGRLVPRSAAVITTNAEHEGALRDRFPAARLHRLPIPPNVTVVPDPDGAGRAAARARWSLPDDAEVVAFFGFVHPVKGVRYLVDALAELAEERPGLRLLAVGGFTSLALPADEAAAFREELTAHVAAAGVTDRVVITGHLPAAEVSAALAAADLAALPFTAGATTKSGALLATLDHGLPTIVTRRPDQEPDGELVDGKTVVVAPAVRDAGILATALRRLLEDPGLAARVGAGGRELLAGRDWTTLAGRHRDVYAEVCR